MRELMGMMKQAKQLQAKMEELQDEVSAIEVEGSAAGGLVSVTADGKGGLKRIRIDPSLMVPDEVEILEDLIIAAASDARGKAEAASQEKMQELTAGLPIPPGVKLPF